MTFFSAHKKKIILLSGLTFLASLFSFAPDYFEISKNLDIFNAVYKELNAGYVDETKPGKLMKVGIDAMLNSLDPYTVYYSENDIEDYRYMTTGEYGGIGATVNDVDGKIMIAEPYEGFAAFRAGLRAGDQIVGVNNNNVLGKKTDDISILLKGTSGTTVNLKVLKAGEREPVVVPLVREEIKTKAVPFYGVLENSQTGYIKLSSFTEKCSDQVKEALLDLKGKNCKSLVLDLRGNLGGFLNEAVNIVNFFIPKGQEVVFTKGKIADWDKSYMTVYNPIDTDIPLAVLVDENSASASEIVSGALQDLDRALIIGQRTYGKGLVQQTKPLVYNSSIKITVAKYYIPSGRCVQALDYANRNADGRVEKVPDSLITAFKTKGGRIVYDGAGVMPDVRAKDEHSFSLLISLLNQHHIFNYATVYYLSHRDIGTLTKFSLNDEEYNDFVNYLNSKNYNFESEEALQLKAFKKHAEEDSTFAAFKAEYTQLQSKLNEVKKNDMRKQKGIIKKFLEEEIVSRYYFQKGRIEFSLNSDPEVLQAIALVNDKSKYKAVLSLIEKPNKPFNLNKKF
jgi:carboxyl-terminal processing protease